MARFIATMQNQRGTHRKLTGNRVFTAHIRGWDVGVRIILRRDPKTGRDKVIVYRTGGSNDDTNYEIIARLTGPEG